MKKVNALIGLAMKAGKVVSGESTVETTIRSEEAYLVLIAEDASKNTTKKFTNMCTYRHVPMYFYQLKTDLGRMIGKEYRASLAITDEGFADAIIKLLESR